MSMPTNRLLGATAHLIFGLGMRHSERCKTDRIGWLRAAVLGANDGVVSTVSLLFGSFGNGFDVWGRCFLSPNKALMWTNSSLRFKFAAERGVKLHNLF